MNGEHRKAMADQITTANKQTLLRRVGVLGAHDIDAVAKVVRIQLGL